MDLLAFGIVANLSGLLIPLIFSVAIARTYRRPYFSQWTASFAFFFVSIAGMLLPGPRAPWLSLLMLTVYMGGGWALLRTGVNWRDGAGRRGRRGAADHAGPGLSRHAPDSALRV